MNKERGNVLVIILGVVLLLFVIGFFRSSAGFWGTVNYKTVLRLPCGLTVNDPKLKAGERVVFPFAVDGYINSCGWNPTSGIGQGTASAGTAQVFDGKGLPVTKPSPLSIPAGSTDAPYYFSTTLFLSAVPSTDSGYLLLTSTTGLISTIPVAF